MNKTNCAKALVVAAVVGLISFSLIAGAEQKGKNNFCFVQLSDTHWGFNNPQINPDFAGTLKKAIALINNMRPQPDFVVFSGDLTHTTDNPIERKKRLTGYLEIIKMLNVKDINNLPGEHDAGLDTGVIYRAIVGKTNYSFDFKGVHFIVLDNVSQPHSTIGNAGIDWMKKDLASSKSDKKIIVLTHRPLFDLYPEWDWATTDGSKALDLLSRFSDVTVFYGHIHQVNHTTTGNIEHYAAMGLMYPLPAPGSVPKKAPIPWNDAKPYDGLGFRTVEVELGTPHCIVTEYPLSANEREVSVTAKEFEYSPSNIELKKGEPVVLKLTSLDRQHGFNCTALGLRADINPGKTTEIHFVPSKSGVYNFQCDVFCGEGHEDMTGTITVKD